MMGDWAERSPSILFACDDRKQLYEKMRERRVQPNEFPGS
jgi:hypothetical protein